jgi:hypothetical protein
LLGKNDRGDCFPLPAGCDESGRLITPAVTAITARGASEAGGFG